MKKGIKFLAFTDLHYDQMKDGDERLERIIRAIKENQPDFCICLGDFCDPVEKNKLLVERLKKTGCPIYFTVGNTELLRNSLEETLEFWEMDKPYYAFENEDYRFIILDTNYFRKKANEGNGGTGLSDYNEELSFFGKNYKGEIFPIVPEEEMRWLEKQLEGEKKKIVFSHHSLANEFQQRGVYNRAELQNMFRRRNVILCMNGHDHGDGILEKDGKVYYSLISASYIWLGIQIDSTEELKAKYGYLNGNLIYRDPFYVIVDIDGSDVRINGMKGEYQSVTPDDIGLHDYRWNGVSIRPEASSYHKKQ